MKKIAIFAEMILQYDMKPENFLSGGGEKWQLEFIKILHELGYKTEIYQYSNEKKTVKFNNIEINGLGCLYEKANKLFHETTNREDIDGYIYMVMNLNEYKYNTTKKPKIGISHGIFWDDCIYRNNQYDAMERFKKWVLNLDCIISVDTNTFHLAQGYFPKYQHKINVIPNFVDTNIFYKNKNIPNNNFRVLYPRRIHILRGIEPFILVANELTKKYKDIEFTICGKGFTHDCKKCEELINGNNKINLQNASFYKMPKLYNSHHISVIPTIGAEGTSLSALESCSCETPIVSTLTGGLSDIINDNFNGRVCKIDYVFNKERKEISYNTNDLKEKIEWMYLNQDKIDKMGNNGRNLIKSCFTYDRWKCDIIKIINQYLKG